MTYNNHIILLLKAMTKYEMAESTTYNDKNG